jgi:hypothetical protein
VGRPRLAGSTSADIIRVLNIARAKKSQSRDIIFGVNRSRFKERMATTVPLTPNPSSAIETVRYTI